MGSLNLVFFSALLASICFLLAWTYVKSLGLRFKGFSLSGLLFVSGIFLSVLAVLEYVDTFSDSLIRPLLAKPLLLFGVEVPMWSILAIVAMVVFLVSMIGLAILGRVGKVIGSAIAGAIALTALLMLMAGFFWTPANIILWLFTGLVVFVFLWLGLFWIAYSYTSFRLGHLKEVAARTKKDLSGLNTDLSGIMKDYGRASLDHYAIMARHYPEEVGEAR